MLEDNGDKTIIQGIIALARAFDRQIVAEGIETDAHSAALLEMGCEVGQGYGIARPMYADALKNWHAERLNSDPAIYTTQTLSGWQPLTAPRG
jgi:EAL domain-containing protein (putative c-di-GMP-specific phosphodiesterase class I)